MVGLSHRQVLKMQKTSKNYKQFTETQIIEAIVILSYYLNILSISLVKNTTSAHFTLREYLSSFGFDLKIIGICYYANVQKKENEHKY